MASKTITFEVEVKVRVDRYLMGNMDVDSNVNIWGIEVPLHYLQDDLRAMIVDHALDEAEFGEEEWKK